MAEDCGKFLFMPRADKQQRWPGTLNGIFIEEFDAAKGDSAGAAGPFSCKSSIIRFLKGVMVYLLFVWLMERCIGGIPHPFQGDQKCDLNQKIELVGN